MRDNDVELANVNDRLEFVLNERKRLLEMAPQLFDMLFNFCHEYFGENFIVETFWEIVKGVLEDLAIELHNAKKEAENYSVKEELESLKRDATDFLRESQNADIREKWKDLGAEDSAREKVGL